MRRHLDASVRHWHGNQKLRFLVVGGWNTAVGYVVFVALYLLLHARLPYLVIGAAAHAIAIANAFVAQRWLVFRSRGAWRVEFVRFFAAQLFVLGSGLAALWLLVSQAGLSPLPAQAIVAVGTVVVSYYAHRHFSFAADRTS